MTMSSIGHRKGGLTTIGKKRKLQKKGAPITNTSSKGKGLSTAVASTIHRKRAKKSDEEIASESELESDIDGDEKGANALFSSDDGEEETAQDKRLRLAKEYLEEIERQEAERAEETELSNQVSKRLHTEYLDSVGRLRRNIADSIVGYEEQDVVTLRHKKQKLPPCALVLSPDGKFLYSGAKTQHVVKWNLEKRKVEGTFDVQPHAEDTRTDIKRRSHVIAMCLSSDMKFLALAEGGNNIQIWCPNELKHLKTFKGHRDVVTSLVFRKDTHELYSGSRDRAVKIWSLDEMAYVESLFGHQAPITGIDALSRERAISAGGTDCSLRIWKITEESQLIYNGHRGSIESVKFLNEEHFVSTGDDGSICLWSALKKKPLCTETHAHGFQQNGEPNWISTVAAVVNTDLIATGSCDGFIRLWKSENARKIKKILEIPMLGFINSLVFNAEGTKLYAAVGQEHRNGRWWRMPEAKNQIVIIDLITNKIKAETS